MDNPPSISPLMGSDAFGDFACAAEASTKTLSQLSHLLAHWGNAPEQIHHLRSDVERLSSLLDSVTGRQGREDILRLAGATCELQDPTLMREVRLATRSLGSVRAVVEELESRGGTGPGSRAGPWRDADAARRHRWTLRRDDIARAQRSLQLSCQHILSRLVVLSLSVSTEIHRTVQRSDQMLKDCHEALVGHQADKFDGPTSQLLVSRQSNDGRNTAPTAQSTRIVGTSAGLDTPPQPRPTSIETRQQHNEQRFHHLEHVFHRITAGSSDNIGMTARGTNHIRRASESQDLRTREQRKSRVCQCRCHNSKQRSGSLSLTAFATTLGTISFYFTGLPTKTCDRASCTEPQRGARFANVRYTFPAWLFRATISTVYSDGISNSSTGGPPELVLRVCRRVPKEEALRGMLYSFVVRGELENVKRSLQRRECAVTDVMGEFGDTILHTAFNHLDKDLKMLELLVQEGADWFQAKDNGHAAWVYAFQYLFANPNITESARQLLFTLVPVDVIVDMMGLCDLHKIVVGINHIDVREFLRLRSGPVDVSDTAWVSPLFYAASRGDVDTAMALLDAGADPEYPRGQVGAKPLFIACQFGNLEVVRLLIENGADVNSNMAYLGRTPLIWLATFAANRTRGAANTANEDRLVAIARVLIEAGTDVSAEDVQQCSPIYFASEFNHAGLVEYLIACGADVDHRNNRGLTPLMAAVLSNSPDVAAVLLQHGADCDLADRSGSRLLHHVARSATADMIGSLIDLAAAGLMPAMLSTVPEDGDGLTPLQVFGTRPDASPEMRYLVHQLLDVVGSSRARVPRAVVGVGGLEGEEEEEEEEEEDVFYDAVGSLDSPVGI